MPASGCGGKFNINGDTNSNGTTASGATTSAGTTASTKATLSGTVSGTLAKPQLKKPNDADTGALHSPMGGGKVQVINSKGLVAGTATIAADGTYSVSVEKGANYIVKATKGNVCLKSYVEKADADKTITVDPASSAVVKVLGKKIGNDKLGEEGEDVSNKITSSDIAATIVAINNSGQLVTIATAIQADISAHADYTSTTITVGVVSTAGDSEANNLVINISITVTIGGQGGTLSAPAGVTATAGDGKVTVTWNAVTGATSYNLYYSGAAGVAGIKIHGITTGTSYTLTGLTNGTTYYFTVTASNSSGESAGSTQVSSTPQIPAPDAPTGLAATAKMDKVSLSWNAVNSATSYNVYYRTVAGVTPANGTKVANAVSGGDITGLTGGTTYYFVVTAVNAGGESPASAQVSATPAVVRKWVTKASMQYGGVIKAVNINGLIYVITRTYSVNVWVYNPQTDTWQSKASLTSIGNLTAGSLYENTVVSVNGIIYLFGGHTPNSDYVYNMYSYDPVSNTWSEKASEPYLASSASAEGANGVFYLMPAYRWVGIGWSAQLQDYVAIYDPATNSWGSKSAPNLNRLAFKTSVVNGIIYMFGGQSWTAGGWDAKVIAYDPATSSYSTKNPMPRILASFCMSSGGSKIYRVGGMAPDVYPAEKTVDAYDPATDTWTALPDMSVSRARPGAVVVNGVLYVFGGATGSGNNLLTSVEAYE